MVSVRHRCLGGAVAAAALLVLLWAAAVAVADDAGLVGAIEVETEPRGVRIYVDDALRGTSPCKIEFVKAGTVEVKAEMEGFAAAKEIVDVRSNEVTKVQLRLPELKDVGHLELLVQPAGSDVRLDGAPRGTTPLRLINISAGTHALEFSHEGCQTLRTNVIVVAGRDTVIRRELSEGADTGKDAEGAHGEGPAAQPGLEGTPAIGDMPYAQAFDPVRKLLANREYDKALDLLDHMAENEETRQYADRIVRYKRLIEAARHVVEAGYDALRDKVGQDYPLLLRGNLLLTGKILGVSDSHVEMDLHGTGEPSRIRISRVHIDRIVKLASQKLDPDDPSNQAAFAVAYAMQEAFPEAYRALERAGVAGHDITDEKTFVDSAKFWKVARLKDEAEKREAARQKELERLREAQAAREAIEALILVDQHHGAGLDRGIAGELQRLGFKIEPVNESITEEDFQRAAVLLVCDPGPEAKVSPYSDAEVAEILDFIQGGGGFVFVGACRAREASRGGQDRLVAVPSPFTPLLVRFGMAVESDMLLVSNWAPRDVPREFALALPARRRHAVVSGLGPIWFKLRNSTVAAPLNTLLLGTSGFVRSSATGRGWVAMAAARPAGRGRVVVLGGLPEMSGREGNDGIRFVMNVMRWAATPRLQAATQASK